MNNSAYRYLSPLYGGMDDNDSSMMLRWANDPDTRLAIGGARRTVIEIFERTASEKQDAARAWLKKQWDSARDDYTAAYEEQKRLRAKVDAADRAKKEAAETAKREAEEAESKRQRANVTGLVDRIARRLGFAGSDDLYQQDGKHWDETTTAVEGYLWGDKPLKSLDLDVVGWDKAAGAIYKRVILPGLGKRVQGQVAARQEQAEAAAEQTWDKKTLRPAVIEFLREHEPQSYTYNQVAEALAAPWKDVSATLRNLACDEESGVVVYEALGKKTKDGKTAKVRLWKYAPWRAEIDRDPGRTDKVVRRVLVSLIAARPGLGFNQIDSEMRTRFGHLAEPIVRRNLKTLTTGENPKVVCRDGYRRSIQYFVAADAERFCDDF